MALTGELTGGTRGRTRPTREWRSSRPPPGVDLVPAEALSEVYSTIELGWTTQAKRLEVTALFAAAAAVLVLAAALLALSRSGRVV